MIKKNLVIFLILIGIFIGSMITSIKYSNTIMSLVSDTFAEPNNLAPLNSTSLNNRTIDDFPEEFHPMTPKPTPTPPIRLGFVGDIMMDRHIRVKQGNLGGYSKILSEELCNYLESHDIVIANLEGPITTNASKSVGSVVGSPANYIFTFAPESTQLLTSCGIKVVSLGNNHILNFGKEGEKSTRQYLEDEQISFFGDTGVVGEDEDERFERMTHIETINAVKFGFVGYNQFATGSWQRSLDDVARLRTQVDVLIVYPHWGNEYVPENATLKEQARQLMAQGADLIVGSHPHVITGQEDIENKRVYYSLGNFVFDQYFEPAVRKGLVVTATFQPDLNEFQFAERYVSLETNGQTKFID